MRVDLNSRLNYISFNAKKKSYPIQQNNNILNDGDIQTSGIKKIYTVPVIEVLEFHPVRILVGSDQGGDSGVTPPRDGDSTGDSDKGFDAKQNMFTLPDYTWDNDL